MAELDGTLVAGEDTAMKMQMLYDSDAFVVVHIDAGKPRKKREGYEIVDKRTNREVYLDGPWAAAFERQIKAWQQQTPTQEDVEEVLESYAELAHYPLVMH